MKKGIILAGGRGSRIYPSTVAVSKQLLPIYDKPSIYYALSTLIKLDITDILIISNDVNHYKTLFGFGCCLGIKISYEQQITPGGIAEAFIYGEKFIGNDNVCLILGDNIFTGIDKIDFTSGAKIIGYKVNNPQQYGVVELDSKNNPINIIEKPKKMVKNPWAVTGLYFYDNTCIEKTKSLTPSKRGELEITDLNNLYLKENTLKVDTLNSNYAWFDTGDVDQMFEASMYIKSIQNRTGKIVGGIELDAFNKKLISLPQLKQLIKCMPDSAYKTKINSCYEENIISR